MEKEYKGPMGTTGPITRGSGLTGPAGPEGTMRPDSVDDNSEMLRLLRSIDENVKQINKKLNKF